MELWLSIAGLTTAGLGIALAPLLRRRAPLAAARAGYDIAVYRAQLAEIERDLARGLLSAGQAEAVQLETKRRILAVAAEPGDAPADRGARPLAALLALTVAGSALWVYSGLGSPGVPDLPYAQAQAGRLHLAEDQSRRVGAMVDQLVARLTAKPDDIVGWQMLGRSYIALGRDRDAADAFRRAVEQGASEPDTLSSFGEALVRAEGGTVTAEARDQFVRTLRQSPQDARARFYLGRARRQVGETAEALAIWKDLERSSAEDSPWLPVLRQEMRDLATRANLDLARITPAPPLFADPRDEPAPPRDVAAWMHLAQSHRIAGQFDKARAAYAGAIALAPDDIDLKLAYADLLRGLLPDGRLSDDLTAVMKEVVALEPDHPEALFILGLNAAQTGRPDQARAHWRKLLALLPAGSPDAEAVRGRLAALER